MPSIVQDAVSNVLLILIVKKMDLQISFFWLLFPSFLLIISLVFLKSKNKNPPPGPWKLPIIGNIHQLLGPHLPHRRLRDLANLHGPLMSLKLGQVPYIVISSPEVAKQVMKTHDTIFAYRPFFVSTNIIFYNCQDIAFAPYGEYWRQMRKIFGQELLHAKRVQSFRPVREEEASNLVTVCISGGGGGSINLSKIFFSFNYGVISKAVFGHIAKENEESFRGFVTAISGEAAGVSIADIFPSMTPLMAVTGWTSKLEKLHQETDTILENIIREHKDDKGLLRKSGSGDHQDNLVHVLLNLQANVNPSLSDTSIKAVLLDMFLAGTETASTTVEWAMSELMRNPIVMKKAQEEVREVFGQQGKVTEDRINELSYMKLVIKETLRLHPPIPLLLPRENSEACEINGYHIPAKTRVLVNAWALGRDPNYWVEAESFNPDRFSGGENDYRGASFEYIPFGSGKRICPGILFGMASVELPLANLLFHFDWKLPDGKRPESLDMVEAFGQSTGRKNALVLIPVPHHCVPAA